MPRKPQGRSAGCGEPFSPWHGKDGKFVNPDEEKQGSWSCKEKRQMSRNARSKRFTKTPCGRKARAQGKNVRCHDGKVISSEAMDTIRSMVEEELMKLKPQKKSLETMGWQALHIPTLVSEFERLLHGQSDGLIDEADCGKCIRNYLNSLDAAIRASKGDLKEK